jgi:replicative DNA helicase
MSQVQTLRRFVSHEARVPLDLMRRNADNPAAVERLTLAASRVAGSGLIVADLSRDTRLSRLIGSAQAAKSRGGLDVLVLDYLGLVTLDGSRRGASRYEVTTELSREVKLAALRLRVAVVLLVQLSREPERREGGKPQLSDLRDSGAIEQDADAVILIHRLATSSEGAFLVAKNRNGPCGEVPITFDGATFTFRERTEGVGDYAQH